MPTFINSADRKKLFTKIYHQLGAPVRKIEITEEMMDTYLEIAVEDYSKYINEWLIDQQWGSLGGIDAETSDINFALMTKSLDFARSFSYAYSKQVGLGTNSPWELKKDFVTLIPNQQTYIIPAGREINEVLWHTPPMIGKGYDPLNSNGWTASEFGWSVGGQMAGYVQPMFNTLLVSQDAAMRNKIFKSEFSYRVTGMADGTKRIHLYPIPYGGHMPTNSTQLPKVPDIEGAKVWYWYYETPKKASNKCKKENADIIRVPSDVPVEDLTWNELNNPAKTWVRQYLLALTKAALGKVRGKYSGQLNVTDVAVTMDYADLLAESITEKSELITELKERLDKMTYASILERQGNEAESLNKILSYIPMRPSMF